MQKTRLRDVTVSLPVAMMVGLLFPVQLHAVTIEDIAAKNNKIIELDQDIAIAEKNKKLAEIKSSYMQPETIVLPKMSTARHQDTMAVISVHGTPANPIVDVQYGEVLLQKKKGEALPDGWEIADVDASSVTFIKKVDRKKFPLIKKIAIGRGRYLESDGVMLPAQDIAAPFDTVPGR